MGPIKGMKQKSREEPRRTKRNQESKRLNKTQRRWQPKEGKNSSRCKLPAEMVVDFPPNAAALHKLSTAEAKAVIVRKTDTIKLLMKEIKYLEETVKLISSPVALKKQKSQKIKIKKKWQATAKKTGNSSPKQLNKNKNNKKPVTPDGTLNKLEMNTDNNKKLTIPKGMDKVASVNTKSETSINPTPISKQKKKRKKNKAAVTANTTDESVVPIENKECEETADGETSKQKKKKNKKNKATLSLTAKTLSESFVPSENKESEAIVNGETPKKKKKKE